MFLTLSALIFAFCVLLTHKLCHASHQAEHAHDMQRGVTVIICLVFLFGLSCSLTGTTRMFYVWRDNYVPLYDLDYP